jgi:hypothetical protein
MAMICFPVDDGGKEHQIDCSIQKPAYMTMRYLDRQTWFGNS